MEKFPSVLFVLISFSLQEVTCGLISFSIQTNELKRVGSVRSSRRTRAASPPVVVVDSGLTSAALSEEDLSDKPEGQATGDSHELLRVSLEMIFLERPFNVLLLYALIYIKPWEDSENNIEFHLVLGASISHVLLARGKFLFVLVNNFIKG